MTKELQLLLRHILSEHAAQPQMLGKTNYPYVLELFNREFPEVCPFDTDGDGDCGRKFCPYCGISDIPDPGEGYRWLAPGEVKVAGQDEFQYGDEALWRKTFSTSTLGPGSRYTYRRKLEPSRPENTDYTHPSC